MRVLVIVGRKLETAQSSQMPDSASRPLKPGTITFGIFCVVVLAASELRLTTELDGWLGIVFALLIFGAPVLIAAAGVVTVWRLMSNFLPHALAVPERMLFALATFVAFCGSGPLAISFAVMTITRREGPMGAAGMWALASVLGGALLAIFGILIAVLRFVPDRSANSGS